MVILDRTPAAAAVAAVAAASTPSPLRRSSPRVSQQAPPPSDPILPCLRSIRKAIDEVGASSRPHGAAFDELMALVKDCIDRFGDDYQYSTDPRLLKIWILYADAIQDFEKVYRVLEEKGMFLEHALLYEAYALFLSAKGKLVEADRVYTIGVSRKAEPLDQLKKMHVLFLKHVAAIVEQADAGAQAIPSRTQKEPSLVDPWSDSTRNNLLKMINSQLKKYTGYYKINKPYTGKVPLTSSQNALRNKVIELGSSKYQIKGCPGSGGFAQVYKAIVDGNNEEVVALKIQKPAFPWEFYMYRQLDKHICNMERQSFGYAHEVHVFSDVSVLVCDYLPYGTLLDAINAHVVVNRHMDEVLCIYYTIEMLHMLETLHGVGIIHGDFKPDNLLVCYPRGGDLTEDTFRSQTRSGRNQGLCLVDWGRGIDLNLFPVGIEFQGDCRTSGFSCVQMQEEKTWTYQVDTYGLCVIVHMMLHGACMSIEKTAGADGSYQYKPKSQLKRYWNVELWRNLFSTLLNMSSNVTDVTVLRSLRKSFEEYMCSNNQLISKLNELLAKQKASLCSA